MAIIARVRTVLTGWQGGPGLMTTYWANSTETGLSGAEADDALARVRGLWVAVAPFLATGLTSQVQGEIDQLDTQTGVLQSRLNRTAPSPVVGSGGAVFGPPHVAFLATFLTDDVVAGRRIKGRSYICPLSAARTDTLIPDAGDCAVVAGAVGNLNSGATGVDPRVWHRPKGQPPAGGSAHLVTAGACPQKWGILRSRRDA